MFCKIKHTLVISSVALLSACGGGSGDGDAPILATSVANFPIQAVSERNIGIASSVTLTASDASGTVTLTASTTPRSDAVFEGVIRKVASVTGIIKLGNALLGTSSSLQYYGVNPARSYGSLDTDDGEYTVDTATGSTPVTAKVGQTWSGYISTVYSNATKSTVLRNETTTYSLEADTASTAFLCSNIITSGSRDTVSSCRRIDIEGNVLGYRMTIFVNGQALTFQ